MAEINWKEKHKQEATVYVSEFYRTSWNWRNEKYHADWDTYERNYKNIYDPTIKAKKAEWQATMFDPMTVTNVEVVKCSMTRLLLGQKRPIHLERRELGDELQAALHSDVLDYEIEKSKFIIEFFNALGEACEYGDGFLKFFWIREYANRRMRVPVPAIEGIKQVLSDLMQFKKPQWRKVEAKIEKVLVKDNVKVEKVHIRDIFLEPNSIDMKKVLHRRKLGYGELSKLADEGYFDEKSVKELETVKESENFEQDIQTVKADEGISDTETPRSDFEKKHTVWEFWGPIPKKWIYLEMPENSEKERKEANELIPGRILVASANYFLGSEENQTQSMEPPFVKIPYIISGSTYDIGISQLIGGIQEESNEIRNLRVDNVVLSLNKIFAVLEKACININEVVSKPGGMIRIKSSVVDDVRKAFAEVPISDVAISAFRETGELERKAQEVTAANRMTTGSAGMVKDQNQTLGGMELLRQAAFDRFNVYAFIIGQAALIPCAEKIMEFSYLNSGPERIRRILGDMPIEYMPGDYRPKWQLFEFLPIHELIMSYDFKFVDIFGQENKQQKRQGLASTTQLMGASVPNVNWKILFDKLLKYDDFEPEERTEILEALNGPMPTPMGKGMGVPSVSKQTKVSTGEVAPPQAPTLGMG